MDNEAILQQFEIIEQKLEKVLQAYKACETKNTELKNKIEKLEEELQGRVEAENSYLEERVQIRSRIDGLMARLEEITEASSEEPTG